MGALYLNLNGGFVFKLGFCKTLIMSNVKKINARF